jgi:hypothetical protein
MMNNVQLMRDNENGMLMDEVATGKIVITNILDRHLNEYNSNSELCSVRCYFLMHKRMSK